MSGLDEWIGWAIGLAIAVPIILVILTEIIGALARKGSPAVKPLSLLRNWVVPTGALFALLVFASRSEADQVWPRVVATVLGFLVILLLLSAFNVALFANARQGSWRERIPSIFVEIVRLVVVVVGLAFLFQWVWGADVGGLVAALGVTSIVIGLALQNAVGGVISGLLLLFEQPFKIGDWLEVGGIRGRVIEVNWRACHIDTGSGIQIVPNSTLSGASFTNLSLPAGPFFTTTSLTFTTDDPPHEVISVLTDVAEALPMRATGMHATAEYAGGGSYSVTLPIIGPVIAEQAMSLYLSWLWYAARRRGLALDGDATDPIAEPAQLERAIGVVGSTLHLGEIERESVMVTGRLERYGAGEMVQAAGVVPDDIRFVVDGLLRVVAEVDGGQIDVMIVEPGDYVGQTALTREPALTATIAHTVTTVLVVPFATLDRLAMGRPLLAREIGESLEIKRRLVAESLATAGVVRGSLGVR